MTKLRILPFVWLTFSGGGVIAAVFLPVLVVLFALVFPLGWASAPDHAHLDAVVTHPVTRLVLLGLFVPMLVHAAHRFRYTLYDGLQLKHQREIAVLCYGAAAAVSFAALRILVGLD
jgi:succinate dehydrogenase subunit D